MYFGVSVINKLKLGFVLLSVFLVIFIIQETCAEDNFEQQNDIQLRPIVIKYKAAIVRAPERRKQSLVINGHERRLF